MLGKENWVGNVVMGLSSGQALMRNAFTHRHAAYPPQSQTGGLHRQLESYYIRTSLLQVVPKYLWQP